MDLTQYFLRREPKISVTIRFPSSISLSSALDEAFHSLILFPKDLETYDFNTTLASRPMKKLVLVQDSAITVLTVS